MSLAIIGSEDECKEFEQATFDSADLVLVKPMMVCVIAEKINIYIGKKKKAEREEEERRQAKEKEYCERYNRGTEIGAARCRQCGKHGAQEALREGKSKVYICHAFYATVEYDIPNLRIIKKPVYAFNLALILKNREKIKKVNFVEENAFDFIAPEAEVLIVDDNPTNLTVAEGLLEPLQMKVSTASGGVEAIEKISIHQYDLILMDHMMPELDGVETTHIIRRFNETYKNIPIIMLTANAVDGTKQMFLQEGINDFVAKPIEVKVLVSAIKRWLPGEKIQKEKRLQTVPVVQTERSIVIGDLDIKTAVKRLGSEKLFWTVLENYYKTIDKKVKAIRQAVEESDWETYTIEVHALKSTSKQIGADELSKLAAKLECAGKARDIDTIKQENCWSDISSIM